jgi:DNA-binding XRE family transcriptional regulator
MGAAVVMLRERAGITCADLAEKIGVRESDMERIERGEVDADWATLRSLAREVELPLETLIELAEERAPGEGGEQWRRWSREVERERDVG